jgi:hypothetical protein
MPMSDGSPSEYEIIKIVVTISGKERACEVTQSAYGKLLNGRLTEYIKIYESTTYVNPLHVQLVRIF